MASPAKAGREDEEEWQALLASLVESERYDAAIKTIYDRNWVESYDGFLLQHVERRNGEIRQICHDHYGELINSVSLLNKVRQEVDSLKQRIVALHDALIHSGEEMTDAASSLLSARRQRRNVVRTLDLAKKIKAALGFVADTRAAITQGKPFRAVKLLQGLQASVPQEVADVSLLFSKQVALLQSQLLDSANKAFATWLSSLPSAIRELGRLLMEQEGSRRRNISRMGGVGASPPSEPQHAMGAAAEEEEADEELESNQSLFAKSGLDLAPVYQCLHVYESLDRAPEFQARYIESRKAMAAKFFTLPRVSSGLFLTEQSAFFQTLGGFFLVDDAIVKSGIELMPRFELDSLWDSALSTAQNLLEDQATFAGEAEPFLRVKQTTVLFCRSLEAYGFSTAPLLDYLASQMSRFKHCCCDELRKRVAHLLETSKFQSMVIQRAEDYEQRVAMFHLAPMDSSSVPASGMSFPVTMPFSASVPEFCRCVCSVIDQLFAFSVHLKRDLESSVVEAIEEALTAVVDHALNQVLVRSEFPQISQVVMIACDVSALADACSFFEAYIQTFQDSRYPRRVHLKTPRTAFLQTRARCEDLLVSLVRDKIDAVMALAVDREWALSSPPAQQGPSDYVCDLVNYMKVIGDVIWPLGKTTVEVVHFLACRHVAEQFMSLLVDSDVKAVNIMGICCLEQDLRHVEIWARDTRISGLVEIFSQVRQFLELFIRGAPEQFLDPRVRAQFYPHISPSKLVRFLDKYREPSMFSSNVPAHMPKIRKKSVDAIVKALREQGDV